MINTLFKNYREIAYSASMPRGRDIRAGEHDKGKKNHAWWLDCVNSEGRLNRRVLTNKPQDKKAQIEAINSRWEKIEKAAVL